MEVGMKESYRKGVANHPDPESCAGHREVPGEALDRGTDRQGIELRNQSRSGCRRCSVKRKATLLGGGKRESSKDPAQSEAPGMSGNSMRENRETPQASAQGRTARRSQKRKSGMNVCGESSDRIVPTKHANKRQGTVRRSMWREGGRPRRIPGTGRCWTQGQATSVHYSAVGRTCGRITWACFSPRWEPCAIGSQARVCAGGVR